MEEKENKKRLLPNYPYCFICGKKNPTGIQANFYREGEKVRAYCKFTEYHAGYKGIVHGGLICSLLDEVLGRIIASKTKKIIMTGNLEVTFKKPIPVGTEVIIEAEMDKEQRHPKIYLTAHGEIINKNDPIIIYAKAKGRFFPIPEEKYQEILDSLKLEGQNRPVTLEDL